MQIIVFYYDVLKPGRLKLDPLEASWKLFGGYLDTGSMLDRNLIKLWIHFGDRF